MSKRPLTASTPAEPGDRVRLTAEFERTQLLGILFGEFDRNLVAIENRLGVYISARGNRVQIEGEAEAAARARDVLTDLYNRIEQGQEVDTGMVDGVIAMSAQPTLAGIIRHDKDEAAPVVMIRTRKKTIVPRAPSQVPYMQALARDEVIFALGPAGTGKTYLAVACAVEALQADKIRRIILVRPAVEAGERLGFLPGDLTQKVDPYLRPMYDALYEMLGFDRVARYIERNVIEVAPLAFMRGRSLNDSYIILDEAQNTTPEQMKMFLTRIGFGSRAVVTGDVTQTDLPAGKMSGLRHVINILRKTDGVSFTFFEAADVVRHPLVQRIVQAYEAHTPSEPT